MGLYATTTSISDLLPNYLIGNTTTSDANAVSIFSRHINRAEAFVNAAVSKKYNASLFTSTALPPLLTQLSEDIACYFALRGASTQDGQIENKNIDKFKGSYDFVQDVLNDKSSITLVYPDLTLVPTKGTNRMLSSTLNYTPITNLDDETAWEVDTDLIDDIASDRE